MNLKPVRVSVALCSLIIATFITSCFVAALTKPLENVIHLIFSSVAQQFIYYKHYLPPNDSSAQAKAPMVETFNGAAKKNQTEPNVIKKACSHGKCVVEVAITDGDFAKYFKGSSPLSPMALTKGTEIISALSNDPDNAPSSVVIDLDLSYGLNDKIERNLLLDSIVRLSAKTPILLSCPKNYIDSPNAIGWQQTEYMRYVTRHNYKNVVAGGGVYFYRPGIDRFALYYDNDEYSTNAAKIYELATKGSATKRLGYSLHSDSACRKAPEHGYGTGSELIRPLDDEIYKSTWGKLITGEDEMWYSGNVLVIGGTYLGNDMFSFVSNGASVPGVRLHGYIINESFSSGGDAPEVFASFFDVFVGILSGFAFVSLWRLVSNSEENFSSNFLARTGFFVFSVILPLSLLCLAYYFTEIGIKFTAAGMVVSALVDAFFTPQEVKTELKHSNFSTRKQFFALGLFVLLSIAILLIVICYSVSFHILTIGIVVGVALLMYSKTSSWFLAYLCSIMLLGYFLTVVLHFPQALPLTLPLLIIGTWLFSFTHQGLEVNSKPESSLSEFFLELLASRTLLAFVSSVLAYKVSVGLIGSPFSIADIVVLDMGLVSTWLGGFLIGIIALAVSRKYNEKVENKHWKWFDETLFSAWNALKNTLAIHVIAQSNVTSKEWLSWPLMTALMMLSLVVGAIIFVKFFHKNEKLDLLTEC